jgi:hypothetical protein
LREIAIKSTPTEFCLIFYHAAQSQPRLSERAEPAGRRCDGGNCSGLGHFGHIDDDFINSTTTRDELLVKQRGAFAERIENTTLALGLRPNQQFSTITYIDNSGDFKLPRITIHIAPSFAQGLGLAVAYTFGKSIDNHQLIRSARHPAAVCQLPNSRTPTDLRNINEEKARSDLWTERTY